VSPASKSDKFALIIVANVKVRMEVKYSIPVLSLHDLLRESFTFTFTCW